jgi:translation initiation factor eIF-2B subunit epsilon
MADETDARTETPLQAVLFCDSFTRTFRPASLDVPKVLCPLNNVCMIDYTLSWLRTSGVAEVIVFAVNQADAIEAYLQASPFSSTMKISVVKDTNCGNPGDALREIDKRGLIRSDPFVCVSGDVVANVDISTVIEEHKVRKKKDNANMMTMLLANTTPLSALHTVDSDLCVGMNRASNQIVLFDDNISSASVLLPSSFFDCHGDVVLHTGLRDCGIDICSPDVLARFSDEFDYRDIRKQFVHNSVAEEEEGLQNRIFGYIVPDTSYAARVHDFRTYHAIASDIVNRRVYPIVPEISVQGSAVQRYSYGYARNHVYREHTLKSSINRSVKLVRSVIVGGNASVSKGCVIENSSIGHNCTLGDDGKFTDCHLWDGVTVEDNVTVTHAVVCRGAVIKSGAVISRGCVVGPGCVIGCNVTLAPFSRITCSERVDDDCDDDDDWDDDDAEDAGDEDEKQATDHTVVGKDGVGRLWKAPVHVVDDDDDDDDEEGTVFAFKSVESQSIGFQGAADLLKLRLEMQGADVDDVNVVMNDEEEFTAGDDMGDDTDAFVVGRQKGVDVIKEMKQLILEHDKSSSLKNLAIEVNSYKFSQNATYADCCVATVLACADLVVAALPEGAGIAAVCGAVKKEFPQWQELFEKLAPRPGDGVGIIEGVERMATEDAVFKGKFRFLLQTLYEADLLSDDVILLWADKRRAGEGSAGGLELFEQKTTQDFLEWLAESSGEDESSEEEDDDDEE